MVVDVLIEVPKGGFVKRELSEQGFQVDYVSPLPSPFNYGCIPGQEAPDGDDQDVIVMGPRLRAGTRLRGEVVAVVRFVDAGLPDDKWVVSRGPLEDGERRALHRFFRVYALARRALNRRQGVGGATEFKGLGPPPG